MKQSRKGGAGALASGLDCEKDSQGRLHRAKACRMRRARAEQYGEERVRERGHRCPGPEEVCPRAE